MMGVSQISGRLHSSSSSEGDGLEAVFLSHLVTSIDSSIGGGGRERVSSVRVEVGGDLTHFGRIT